MAPQPTTLCQGLCTNKYQWGDESTEDRRFRVRFGFSRSEVLSVTEPNVGMRKFLKTRGDRHMELYRYTVHPAFSCLSCALKEYISIYYLST